MVDYPIPMNKDLRKKFEDEEAFKQYAVPLYHSVNPEVHLLTLLTLIKAKWFEIM
jgi:hypothetical protein